MIEHVYRRVAMCRTLDEVCVATCDEEIVRATEEFGGRAIMTSRAHERASDRVAEVARKIAADILVMVQGDEPMIVPEMVDLGLRPLVEDAAVLCTNLAAPIRSEREFEDTNTIKAVMDRQGDALYFSREPIPTRQRLPFGKAPVYKQVCVISFRADFLLRYTNLEPTPLEQAESIDMLRALEHGYPIRLVRCEQETYSVDTPEDLARVERLMRDDPLTGRYAAGGGR
jgi:3-deoxy-manno-octulosonate cytidylyltransferase (CMP-KDO synthetase)